ncbi:Beta-lactamase superfamily domain protein [Bythopirellula polymerisocia]|uniref:Beta-lactamase superfamily domain protein n=2 Tax=Bythopirellula polymerisocia TaxID=2528003 RepID=A0A5C6CQ73_9BACT|nr:Beta-lactamase superfamily domain protein [Bythopirellula polymerisocia]
MRRVIYRRCCLNFDFLKHTSQDPEKAQVMKIPPLFHFELKALSARLTLLSAMASLLVVLVAPVHADMQVTFMGNNGVLLSAGGKKVLVDALQLHNNSFWTRLSSPDLQDLVRGIAPFDNIAYALATHNHPDHYARGAVGTFLANNPDAKFLGPPQVLSSLGPHSQALNIAPAFQTESIQFGEPGIEIEVFHMEHFDQFGNDFSGVQDFTYLITMGGLSLLHLGDVDYINENFENFDFPSRQIDAVVLPTFNTLLTEANKQVILNQINPRHIIAAHLRAGSLPQEEANVRALYPYATIFTQALDSITLKPVPEPNTLILCAAASFLLASGKRGRHIFASATHPR